MDSPNRTSHPPEPRAAPIDTKIAVQVKTSVEVTVEDINGGSIASAGPASLREGVGGRREAKGRRWIPAALLFEGRERVCGIRRRRFLWALYGGVLLLLLALGIGLGVGLTIKKDAGKFIPLPGTAAAQIGEATYYAPGLGSCGQVATEDDPVIAISWTIFDEALKTKPRDANGMNGGACGRRIRVYRILRPGEGPGSWVYDEQVKGGLEGKNVTVEGYVGDRCPGCAPTALDLSPVLFKKIGTESMGRIGIKWAWVD